MSKQSNNKEIKASFWYICSAVIVKGAAFFSTPIFTRILSTSEYGEVSTFLSLYTLLLPVFTLELPYSVGRAKIDYIDDFHNYVKNIFVLSALFDIPIAIVILLFVRFFELGLLRYDYIIILVVYLYFSPCVVIAQNKYRYEYDYKKNIFLSQIIAIGGIILSILLLIVFNHEKVFLRLIGVVLPTIIVSVFLCISNIFKRSVHINIEYWKYGLKISIPLIAHSLSLNILSQSDRVFIKKYCGASQTGIYSLVYMYSMMITLLTTSILDGWLPWFHENYHLKNYEQISNNVTKLVVLGCYIGLACIGLAPEAVNVLGGYEYREGLKCVPVVVLGTVLMFTYTHYVNIEMHLKKTVFVSVGTVLAGGLNVFLNFIIVPYYGYVGAAWTTLISYLMLFMLHYTITKRILHVNIYSIKYILFSLFLTSLLSFVLYKLYDQIVIRCMIIIFGFISMIIFFRKDINRIIKMKSK